MGNIQKGLDQAKEDLEKTDKAAEKTKKQFASWKDLTAQFKTGMTMFGNAAKENLDAIKKRTEEARAKFANLKNVVTGVFAAATASVVGFVRAGLANTTIAAHMALQWQLLSREIAQLFLPAMRRVIDVLDRAIRWFRNLSGEQQNAIGRTLLMAGALGTLLAIVPRVVAGIRAIGAAIVAMEVATGVGAILALVGALGLLASASQRDTFGSVLENLGKSLKPLIDAIMTTLAGIGQAVAPLVEAIAVIGSVIAVIGNLFNPVTHLLSLFGSLLSVFKPFFDLLGKIAERFSKISDRLKPVFERLADILANVFEKAGVQEFIDKVLDAFEHMANRIEELIDRLNQAQGFIRGFAGGLTGVAALTAGSTRPKSSGPREELAQVPSGFEQVTESFRRFQLAALKTDINDPAQQTASNTGDMVDLLFDVARWLQNMGRNLSALLSSPPAVAGAPGGPAGGGWNWGGLLGF